MSTFRGDSICVVLDIRFGQGIAVESVEDLFEIIVAKFDAEVIDETNLAALVAKSDNSV